MALLDVFKKKQKKQPEAAEKNSGKTEKTEKAEKISPKPDAKTQKKGAIGQGWRFLKSPRITEKATDLTKKNQYVFKVFQRANKPEIKKSVENLYKVNVKAVRIVNIPAKKRRLGRRSGWREGYKKAIVTLKKGQVIEIMPR